MQQRITKEKIIEAIRKGRKKKRFTQEEIAKSLGVTRNIIWHWENGKSTPAGDVMLNLALELDIVSDLFPGYVKACLGCSPWETREFSTPHWDLESSKDALDLNGINAYAEIELLGIPSEFILRDKFVFNERNRFSLKDRVLAESSNWLDVTIYSKDNEKYTLQATVCLNGSINTLSGSADIHGLSDNESKIMSVKFDGQTYGDFPWPFAGIIIIEEN